MSRRRRPLPRFVLRLRFPAPRQHRLRRPTQPCARACRGPDASRPHRPPLHSPRRSRMRRRSPSARRRPRSPQKCRRPAISRRRLKRWLATLSRPRAALAQRRRALPPVPRRPQGPRNRRRPERSRREPANRAAAPPAAAVATEKQRQDRAERANAVPLREPGAGTPGAASGNASAAAAVEADASGARTMRAEDWLEKIIKLRREGRHAEADEELKLFRERFPQVRVPADALGPTGTR